MKKFIETLTNVWKIEELRNRIILTLGILLVYRFGAHVILPGVDTEHLTKFAERTSDGGLLNLLNAFTGGAFANVSVFALGIMPYISASIVVQLMGIAIPYLQKLQQEGESGRRRINQITRWLTIAICIVQAPAYLYSIGKLGVPDEAFIMGKNLGFMIPAVIILVTGTIFAMWLGEKITDKGIGNGISLLIMVGIVARMPQAFLSEWVSRLTGDSTGGLMFVIIEVVLWFVVILSSIFLVLAVRQIPVQYARRTTGGSTEKNIFGARQYIPLKLNASGVMPIIFAQAIMFVPAALAGLSQSETSIRIQQTFSDVFGFWYNFVFALLIITFTYFYTAITVPTNKMADDLKRSGGFIPGVKPGTETGDYLDKIMSLITFPGSIFLVIIAILPAFVHKLLDVQQAWALFYGGTSLLILVGVAMDTMQQINSYLLNRHYDGLMKTGKNRKV
ncbi:preprotein translocase subunit SecY [Capnocytophaga catalasegens]|uniref:Protein translocase subunit SecY n=1 Tax=Capnocytophaga catalasegens TaxID=1004260 RepID=A0AAV5AZ44_9FLAO|nr:preprotein translocase subunit SecY [Capnocytophaga catalasegens]GIZ14650.1 protein translocase subunit SecY [Capnocytophaga catalasegens]GJM50852.1 protein translocase subunit SecY [Capnocytophaga catalasegens]GJM52005.1 protein translocase subunit SecY [Capnocytophaga catalasegens]